MPGARETLRVRAILAAWLMLVASAAGCAGVGETLGFAEHVAPPPYAKVHRVEAEGAHHNEIAIPVEAGARELRVEIVLEPPPGELPLLVPAHLDVALRAPEGHDVGRATVTPAEPRAGWTLASPPAGAHLLVVDGAAAGAYVAQVSVSYA